MCAAYASILHRARKEKEMSYFQFVPHAIVVPFFAAHPARTGL